MKTKISKPNWDKVIKGMLNLCYEKNKKSATLTLEDVGIFNHCDIILKVIPKEKKGGERDD